MEKSQLSQFKEAIKKGDKELFFTLLPHMSISKKGYKTILKNNMKWQHDFILKSLFKKKYLRQPAYLQELLRFAIKYKYKLGVTYALKKGANPNNPFKGCSPLLYACLQGDNDIVKILLEHGANSNPLIKYKNLTPKIHAVQKFDMELIELLQQFGARLSLEELDLGIVSAAKANRFDLVDQYVLMGAQILNSTYLSLYFSYPNTIPYLLRRDFSFNLNYHPREHFFIQAARFGRLQTLKEYIKYGRRRTSENELRKTLSAALIAAAGYGREAVITYLLNQGANINFSLNNQTAYDAAIKGNYMKVAHLLHKRGGRSFSSLAKGEAKGGG